MRAAHAPGTAGDPADEHPRHDAPGHDDLAQIPEPDAALRRLDVMVGTWELEGRDLITGGRITGRSRFKWLVGGFFLVHHFVLDYDGSHVSGVEYAGHDPRSGLFRTHVFGSTDAEPLHYTWEVTGEHFRNWFGGVGSPNHYEGRFSDDHRTLIGHWEWPGGGYAATMTRVE